MLFAVLAVLAAAGPAPFTLDQVMSAPFPTGLVAAQRTPRVAWVMNARGARNVWVAEAPEYQGRALTTFAEDDGEEIAGLAFTADAQSVVFVRGGEPNRAGEIPNPRSRTEPRERAVHVVTLAGATRRLAERPLAAAPPPREPHRVRRQEPGVRRSTWPRETSRSGSSVRAGDSARCASRRTGLAGVRQRPRRPRLRRRLRRRPQKRSAGSTPASTATASRPGRPTASASPSCASPPTDRFIVRRRARGRAVVDPRGRRGDRPQPRGLARRHGHGQRLPRGRRRPTSSSGRAATASSSPGRSDGWTHLYCGARGGRRRRRCSRRASSRSST